MLRSFQLRITYGLHPKLYDVELIILFKKIVWMSTNHRFDMQPRVQMSFAKAAFKYQETLRTYGCGVMHFMINRCIVSNINLSMYSMYDCHLFKIKTRDLALHLKHIPCCVAVRSFSNCRKTIQFGQSNMLTRH